MLKALLLLTYVSFALGLYHRDPFAPHPDPLGPPWFPQAGPVLRIETEPGVAASSSAMRVPDESRPLRLEEADAEVVEPTPVRVAEETDAHQAWSISAPLVDEVPGTPEASRPEPSEPPALFQQKNLSGPRLGATLALDQKQIDGLRGRGMGPLTSQFGWHFEHQVSPLGGGPQFLVETVPMFAGVEYGQFIPSLTLAMGVRFPSGAEFGVGPSVSARPGTSGSSALVLAGGRSFDYGGVSVPVNVALSTSPHGQRLSLVLGYAVQQR